VPRKFFRRYLPDPDEVLAKPWCKPFRPWLGHPNLWHLNRRCVAGGFAIGLFCGLIPGPFQMLGALLMAIPLRKNIPVALVTTFYTNPFTILPLYVVAYAYGRLLVGGEESRVPIPDHWSLASFSEWAMSLGTPLAVGLLALAVTLSFVGYFTVDILWRLHVARAWRRRAASRRAARTL
jgi:uncharacterized protein (DUF2062 family)